MDLLKLTSKVCFSSEGDPSSTATIRDSCTFHHYCCDGVNDKGWGCGYRTLQSLCSWAVRQLATPISVPSILEIQKVLVELGDKPESHVGSHDWIGTFEACIVLDHLYGVACKIIHVPQSAKVVDHVSALSAHFAEVGSPVMIGGDVDGASKTLLGVSTNPLRFLIADPHYVGNTDQSSVLTSMAVQWYGPELYQTSSFYNFCLPQPINHG